VVVATSAAEALQHLARERFDVLLSDVGLGAGMNGWELTEIVRSGWPELPIVLATGWGAAISDAEARARGVDAVLAKPYLPADLRRTLEACARATPRSRAA
jgi:CheY-like chemotaxis protein